MKTFTRIGWLSLVLLAAACGKQEEPPVTGVPVLVVRPDDGATAGWSAFAGEIRAREESPLAFRVGGKITRRQVDVGARVNRGDVLAEIDPGDLSLQAQAAQAQLAAAEADLVRARGDQARYATLAEQQLVSRSALDAQTAAYKAAEGQARAARAQWDVARNQAAYAQLRAPADGAIASRQAEAGQVVAAGQTIFTLAGDGGREVAIALPENRIRDFHVGQAVLVSLWNDPDQRLSGTIREISPAADAQTRSYATRVALKDTDAQRVELGQSARVYVLGDGAANAAQTAQFDLPLAAVQRGPDGQPAVWVVDPNTHQVHSRPVRLGTYGSDRVPVLGGITAQDWVVAGGGHLLREGQKVNPVDRDNRPVPASSIPVPAKS